MILVDEKSFDSGFLLILFLWNMVFVSTGLNILGIPITCLNVLLAAAGCLIFIEKYCDVETKKIKNDVYAFSFLVVIVATLLCGSLFDFSWDGNSYQKAIVGLLKEGWNPIYAIYDNMANVSGLFPTQNWATWYDAYPKASAIIGAAFYALTNNIETGKVYTILSCLAGCMIVEAYLSELKNTNKIINVLIAIVLFFNPVSISQCGTYYNDAFLWNLLFITIFICLYFTLDSNKKYEKFSWVLLFCCMSLGINIKFSALIYFALICGTFYFYWTIKNLRINVKNHKKQLEKLTAFFVITVIFSLCFLGSTSYMKNLFLHHNPVYTMIGEDKTEIIDAQSPLMFQGMSPAKRFFISMCSVSSNDKTLEVAELKIPFTVDKKETKLNWIETRLGGWGIFFSGIFIISLFGILICWKKLERNYKQCLLIMIGVTFVPVFFVPGLFWARYWMILFIIPCLTMYLLSLSNRTKVVTIFLLIMSFANIFLPVTNVIENMKSSQFVKIQYEQLKKLSNENSLEIKLGGKDRYLFNGLVFNLKDYQIDNYEYNNLLESNEYISKGRGKISYKIILESDDET